MTLDPADETGLSAPHTAKGRLQRALLELLRVHERDGMLPTSARFLFYELVAAEVISKTRTEARRADQNMSDALTHLRETGHVPWDWIVDETRTAHTFATSSSVAEGVIDSAQHISLDRWDGQPAPLILCESRSLAGVLHDLAAEYACPIASTNGQTKGFLVTEVAPWLAAGQRVLYLGDWDHCGHQIEVATKRTLIEHSAWWGAVGRVNLPLWEELRYWERLALTTEQVSEHRLPVIRKRDKRYRGEQYFDAVETEALSQAVIVSTLRDRLDELMPEPLDDVLERERQQREQVAEQLRQLLPESD